MPVAKPSSAPTTTETSVEMHFDHVAQQVPDIAEAVAWYRQTIPACHVLYQDATWALVEAGGVRLAFVLRDAHPAHLAWRVTPEELERLATRYGRTIKSHRDNSRSFYLEGPGGHWMELIAFPNQGHG